MMCDNRRETRTERMMVHLTPQEHLVRLRAVKTHSESVSYLKR